MPPHVLFAQLLMLKQTIARCTPPTCTKWKMADPFDGIDLRAPYGPPSVAAVRAYDDDTELKAAMGEEFSSAYLKMKHQEWNDFCSHFSSWEKANTLDI